MALVSFPLPPLPLPPLPPPPPPLPPPPPPPSPPPPYPSPPPSKDCVLSCSTHHSTVTKFFHSIMWRTMQ